MKETKFVELAVPALQRRGWNINRLATEIGLNSGYYYQLFNGQLQTVTKYQAERIAIALDLPKDYFNKCSDVVERKKPGTKPGTKITRKPKRKSRKVRTTNHKNSKALARRETRKALKPFIIEEQKLPVDMKLQDSKLVEISGPMKELYFWMSQIRAKGFVPTYYGEYTDETLHPDTDPTRFILRGELITRQIKGKV